MEFKIGSGAIARYRELPYKPQHALAEFIDNSLHSWFLLENRLRELGRDVAEVSCDWDSSNSALMIQDNCGGIAEEDFPRLASVGVKKADSDVQLSKYGMGLKTATIWLADTVVIETNHIDSAKHWRLTMDFGPCFDGGDVEIIREEIKAKAIRAYTIIYLKQVRKNFGTGQTLPKRISTPLQNIYAKFVEEGCLNLTWNQSPLQSTTWDLAKMPGSGDSMRKEINLDFGEGKTINGWIGILEKGAASKGGFSLYYDRRMIRGFPHSRYLPNSIFGGSSDRDASNTLVTQRLVGRLEVKGWPVSHTKDDFDFGSDVEEIEARLAEESQQMRSKAQKRRSTEKPSVSGEAGLEAAAQSISKYNLYHPGGIALTLSTDVTRVKRELATLAEDTTTPMLRVDLSQDQHFEQVLGIRYCTVWRKAEANMPYVMWQLEENTKTLEVIVNTQSDVFMLNEQMGDGLVRSLVENAWIDCIVLNFLNSSQALKDTNDWSQQFVTFKDSLLSKFAQAQLQSEAGE